jgi:large subunit ribosomal protein L17
MRHKVHSHSFNRRGGPRKALIKGLVISLVEHGRIRTTLAKAKELRRHVERAVTLGKKGDVATRRLLTARFSNEKAAASIVNEISPRFKTRAGGYTRILKLNARPGDQAPMAFIEFVDYKLPETKKADSDTVVKGDAGAEARSKAAAKVRASHKKRVRAMKNVSRRQSRKA